jgi:hypothetical protein
MGFALLNPSYQMSAHVLQPDDFQTGGFILRDGAESIIGPRFARTRWRLLRTRSSNPHGEERGNAARLEP